MRTECLNIFLEELSRRYRNNHRLVVLDGAASHRSKDLTLPQHMTLVPLPPYSPELNPQENVWAPIKENGFYNKVFDSLDAVEDPLLSVLRQFEQQAQRLKKLTHWDWIMNALN